MTKVHKVNTTCCLKQKCWGQESINGGLLLRGQWRTTARRDAQHYSTRMLFQCVFGATSAEPDSHEHLMKAIKILTLLIFVVLIFLLHIQFLLLKRQSCMMSKGPCHEDFATHLEGKNGAKNVTN